LFFIHIAAILIFTQYLSAMSLIVTSHQHHILEITLNRPDKFNSFTEPMAIELQKALKDAESDEFRAVLLNARGKRSAPDRIFLKSLNAPKKKTTNWPIRFEQPTIRS
jgi:1,4-dihydroxy-2-naphthoyl-CoA synthase